MSIIFPTKADVVAAITNQEVGLALTVATQSDDDDRYT